jgi:hypothetical protein
MFIDSFIPKIRILVEVYRKFHSKDSHIANVLSAVPLKNSHTLLCVSAGLFQSFTYFMFIGRSIQNIHILVDINQQSHSKHSHTLIFMGQNKIPVSLLFYHSVSGITAYSRRCACLQVATVQIHNKQNELLLWPHSIHTTSSMKNKFQFRKTTRHKSQGTRGSSGHSNSLKYGGSYRHHLLRH